MNGWQLIALYGLAYVAFVLFILWVMLRKRKNDPVYNCERYFHKGCPHVDGLACDLQTCSIKDVVK